MSSKRLLSHILFLFVHREMRNLQHAKLMHTTKVVVYWSQLYLVTMPILGLRPVASSLDIQNKDGNKASLLVANTFRITL